MSIDSDYEQALLNFPHRPHARWERAMSFLQPWMLLALPIAALPVIIHLIHQRRFQSIDWGAMKFLLEANRMSRGYARIRQWLILALRVAAIAALVFLDQPPAGHRLVGPRRRRPPRYDAHLDRPFTQHDTARHKLSELQSSKPGSNNWHERSVRSDRDVGS